MVGGCYTLAKQTAQLCSGGIGVSILIRLFECKPEFIRFFDLERPENDDMKTLVDNPEIKSLGLRIQSFVNNVSQALHDDMEVSGWVVRT
jgi:hypothetical protein